MRGRNAVLALFLAVLVLGSGIAGATALGSSASPADQQRDSAGPTLSQADSKNVTNESSSSGPTVGEPTTSAKDENRHVSSRLHARLDGDGGGGAVGTDGAPSTVEVVVEATPGKGDRASEVVGGAGGEVTARHGDLVQAEVPETAVDGLANSPAVGFVRLPIRPSANEVTSEGVETMNANWTHGQNVTGENVTVAVIDLEGFNLQNDEITDQVVDSKDFTGDGIGTGQTDLHGTAVAELVADTAPNASLVTLRASSTVQWYNAVDYIREETETDVVVMSMSWYGVGPLDGTSGMNQEISKLRANGILWVNSAGNSADRDHWNGTWNDPDGNGLMNFSGNDEYLHLDSGSEANIWMSWDDWDDTDDDYDLYILDGDGNVIGGSTTTQDGSTSAAPREIYTNTSVNEPIYLAIQRENAEGNADFDIWFRGDLTPQYWTAERSVTNPGVGADVLTVGAVPYYDPSTIESFSSRGPTIDGRLKPDIVAPDRVSTSAYSPDSFPGTSAAAPHAAGVAALLIDANSSLGPDAVETTLIDTAVAVNGTEPDTTYGHGLVDAKRAVAPQLISASVNQSTVDFGAVHRDTSNTSTITLENDGRLTMEVTDVSIGGENASEFAIESGGGQQTLAVGETQDIDVRFDSSDRGAQEATLRIEHNGSESPTTVSLAGETVAPDIDVASEKVDFGTVPLEDEIANRTVEVTNNGTAPLNVTGATVAGENASAFSFAPASATPPTVLEPGATATYTLQVQVESVGERNATLAIDHNVSDRVVVERGLTARAVDRTPPEIAQMSADASGADSTAVGRDGSVTVAVNATDLSGVDSVTIDATPLGNDTISLSATTGDWYDGTVPVDEENATDGTFTLDVSVNDTQGNSAAAETDSIVVDLTNASLTVETPAAGDARNQTTVNVTGSADDAGAGVGAVEVAVDAGNWVETTRDGGSWYLTATGLDEGTHDVAVRAIDDAGNVGPETTMTVTVDTTSPVVETAALNVTEDLLPDTAVSAAVTATDGLTTVESVTAGGISLVNTSNTWEGDITTAPALGTHTATVRVRDRAGNVNETTLEYEVGKNATLTELGESQYRASPTDPGIANVTLNATTNATGQNVTVGTATRNPTAVDTPNDTPIQFPQVVTPVPNEDIENATIEVRVEKSTLDSNYVVDESLGFWVQEGDQWTHRNASLRSETSERFVYDVETDHFSTFAVTGEMESTPPDIDGFSPGDGATVSETAPSIEVAYDDAFSGIDVRSVSMSIDGTDVTSTATVEPTGLSYDAALEPGDHDVTVEVSDNAGNTEARSWTFTIQDPGNDDGSASDASSGGGGGGGQGGSSSSVGGKSVSMPISGTEPTLTLGGGLPLESVTFLSDTELDTAASVEEIGGTSHREPDDVVFVAGAGVGVSSGDDVDRIRLGIEQRRLDELGIAPEQLVVHTYRTQYAEWESHETEIVETGNEIVVIEVASQGSARYVLFGDETIDAPAEAGPTETSKSTVQTTEDRTTTLSTTTPETTTSEVSRTTTETETPGFGVVVSMLAILGAAVLALRKQ